jgi:hypothetical protein
MPAKQPTPAPKPTPKPSPAPAPKPQPNTVPKASMPSLQPPKTPTPTPAKAPTPAKTPAKTPTKVEFTGPEKYSPIDPKVQAALDKAKASSDAAKEKADIAKAKIEAAKKAAADAKAKADAAAAKKKAADDAKKKATVDTGDDDTGDDGATGGDFAGKFLSTKSVKVAGGTNIFNVFSNGKGGTYEEFVAFVPDDAGGEDDSAAAAAELYQTQKRDNTRTALEEFVSLLSGAGLGDLADEVNKMILDDKTAAQIKLEIRKTKSYEARFPGMKALSDKNRAITEGEYIDLERGYSQTLRAYGLDEKIYGDRGDLGTYIANEVSAREFEERVSLAKDRVSSQADVMKALGEMYVTEADAIGYLLNPLKAMDVIKKQVRAAEIGAAAASARFTLGADAANRAREAEALIGATGTTDVATLKQEFGKARILADTQSQLSKLEGETYNELEAVQAVVGGEQEKLLKSKRRAEREAMFRFGGQSGVGAYSLRSTTNQ